MSTDIDLLGILEATQTKLPPQALPQTTEDQLPVLVTISDDEWQNDPIPVKLDKIRAAVLNSKTASEVRLHAGLMQIGDWLEMVVKLSPKQMQVQGSFSFKHMMEEFGPIDSSKYKPQVIDIEVAG
jgi:hypothetical protein